MKSMSALQLCLGIATTIVLASAASAQDKLGDDTVVASRGGATITLLDVDAALLRIPPRQRGDAMNSPKRIEDLLNQLLLTRQLANEGLKQGLDRDPIVKHAIANSAENVIGAQTVIKYRESLDPGDVDKLARERYESNPAAYSLPARVTVRHILIDNTKRSDLEAKTLADKVLARAAKDDFEALVMEYSDDPSKGANKGLVDDADSNKMDPVFAEASGRLRKTAELSPVVKSQFGYHIIRLESRTEIKQRSYDEVRVALVEELRNNLTEQRVKEFIDQKRSEALDANPDAVASLRTRYLPKPLLPDMSKAQKTPKTAMPAPKN